MKIGLSYSRCVRDIVEGKVDINDVLIIICRTDFNPTNDEQWAGIWRGYCAGSMFNTNSEWGKWDYENQEHEKIFRDITIELYTNGKMHQPRQFGSYPRRMPYIWLESVLVGDDLEKNSAAKSAWDQFQILAGLTNINLNTESH